MTRTAADFGQPFVTTSTAREPRRGTKPPADLATPLRRPYVLSVNPGKTAGDVVTEERSADPLVPADVAAPRAAWSPVTRTAFRLVASYLIIEGAGFPIGYLPFQVARTVARWYLDAKIALGAWTQVHILGLPSALPHAFTGSGDSM